MRQALLSGIAALFLATGAAHAEDRDILAESGKSIRARARCKMELMKYETMDTDQLNRSVFYTACMESEGYAFQGEQKLPTINGEPMIRSIGKDGTCNQLRKHEGRTPDLAVCWKRVW